MGVLDFLLTLLNGITLPNVHTMLSYSDRSYEHRDFMYHSTVSTTSRSACESTIFVLTLTDGIRDFSCGRPLLGENTCTLPGNASNSGDATFKGG